MTNFEKWMFYCQDIKSPNIYLEFGWYSLIAMALQRRVWRGSDRKPLFPNLYVILVGEPGVGKGLVLEEVEKIINHQDMKMKESDLSKDMLFGNLHKAKKPGDRGVIELPGLINMAPTATSYEMMVFQLASSIRSFFHASPENPEKKKLYVHCSMSFCLAELASIFRKHSDDLVNFLLQTYDCGDYSRPTFERGKDEIHNCCLNILAGTTPSFLKKVFNQELIDQGFASRATFVYALCNRFNRCRPPEFNEEQIKAHSEIIQHIRSLTYLFGEVKFTPEANAFLEYWADKIAPIKRANLSPKLKGYYARKEVTVQKLAIAMHFSEGAELMVGIEECEKALEACERIEKQMHFAFSGEDKNPLASVTQDIINHIRLQGFVKKQELLLQFYRDLPNGKRSLDEIFEFLLGTGQVKADGNGYRIKAP